MRTRLLVFLLLLPALTAGAEELVRGMVRSREGNRELTPVAGANVYWLGTARGTSTDADGAFSLSTVPSTRRLVIHHAAFAADTITVGTDATLEVTLQPLVHEVEGVQSTGERSGIAIDYLSAAPVQRITGKELAKAACCNLSESFETNPSVDVSFTDAITGTKQIEMLGLSGIYTQTSLENMPYIRGLTANVGLTFIPGTWIHGINVSKGVGAVANGYESITGQIDVDLRKPADEDEKHVFLNMYGNIDQRFEGNLNVRQSFGEHWSMMTLLHGSTQQMDIDRNGDRFMDMPVFSTFNAIQRWSFNNPGGWEGQFAAQFLTDRKTGGTGNERATHETNGYHYGTHMQYLRLSGKTGHIWEGKPYQSMGVQWSLGRYTTTSLYGPRSYDGTEETGYLNVIYQSIIGTTEHKFRTGASFLFDRFDEQFAGTPYDRTERVPGAFFEYTWSPTEELTVVAGIRADQHNAYGTMVTPRLHIRYSPDEDWVFRVSGGRGYRTASIFAENATVFASSRKVSIDATRDFGYGLEQEVAWNTGGNITYYFLMDYRQATLSLDVYHTAFERQVVADMDTRPREVVFTSLAHGSYANSVQLELNFQPFERLETRVAYRYLDVQQNPGGVWLQRALNAQHRALVNIAYATEQRDAADSRTTYDLTVQWFGPKRIPSTSTNPMGLRARAESPAFALVNAQISRTLLGGLDLYVGVEDLLDFRQDDPIVDAESPLSPYFDASLVWGPLGGRMIYAGLRWGI
jgi:outer membrane receptor for ferrienterochelin and colicins